MIYAFSEVWRAEITCMFNWQCPGEPAALGLAGPVMSSHVATRDAAIISLGFIIGSH